MSQRGSKSGITGHVQELLGIHLRVEPSQGRKITCGGLIDFIDLAYLDEEIGWVGGREAFWRDGRLAGVHNFPYLE
jgi:hypothetical protein